MFDPPLGRWEKRIGWAWMITGGTAAVAMKMGIFGWWGILIVTIPVLFYALIAPGLFLYMSAIIVPLLLTRQRFRPAGWGVAALLVAVLATAPAWQSARDTETALATAVGDDRGDKLHLPRGGTLALLGITETCETSCIKAMRDHGVAHVLIGDGRTVDPARAVMLPRMRLLPSGGQPCPPMGKTARELDWVWRDDKQKLAAAGLCLAVDTAPLASADLVQRFSSGIEGKGNTAVRAKRVEAWVRRPAGLERVLRRTQANKDRVILPTIYLAPMVADNGSGPPGWWSENVQRGDNVSEDLAAWWLPPA
jgi:hypothetical protein